MYLHFDLHDLWSLIGDALMATVVGVAPLLIAAFMKMEYALSAGPPQFVLVKEGEQVPDSFEPQRPDLDDPRLV